VPPPPLQLWRSARERGVWLRDVRRAVIGGTPGGIAYCAAALADRATRVVRDWPLCMKVGGGGGGLLGGPVERVSAQRGCDADRLEMFWCRYNVSRTRPSTHTATHPKIHKTTPDTDSPTTGCWPPTAQRRSGAAAPLCWA